MEREREKDKEGREFEAKRKGMHYSGLCVRRLEY
jgi:hypothetical protein